MDMLDKAAVTYQIVLTKADKTPATDLETLLKELQTTLKKHPAAFPIPLVTSSAKGEGLTDLREVVGEIVNPA
jgi:GTP-binding protein